jgi:hypothetical protein
MMLGRRVISSVNEQEMIAFFGQAPPLYNCSSADEIAAAMIRVIDDTGDLEGDGRKNQDWMQAVHSADRIVQLQLSRYIDLLAPSHETVLPRAAIA